MVSVACPGCLPGRAGTEMTPRDWNRLHDGIRWIAENDEPTDRNLETIAELISVTLLADVFHRDPRTVAAAVLAIRLERTRETIAALEDRR